MSTIELLEYNGEWYIGERREPINETIYQYDGIIFCRSCIVRDEVKEWLEDNLKDRYYIHKKISHNLMNNSLDYEMFDSTIEYIFLKNKKDFLLFKLRWG